jgi:hypothetical protein
VKGHVNALRKDFSISWVKAHSAMEADSRNHEAKGSKKSGPGFGHGSVPVLATITGMPPSQLIAMDL